MLLHIKNGQDRYFENHETMSVDSSIEELVTHGVNMLSMQINRLYEEGGSNVRWEQNCFDVIENSYDDYIDMLKEFQYFNVEHVTGLAEFEKPIYIGRSFTDDESGETGKVIKSGDEVVIEFENEIWTYEANDFSADRRLNEILISLCRTLSMTDNKGVNDSIFEDIQI